MAARCRSGLLIPSAAVLAKKSRTPPPPRRPVQAPRARTGGDGDRRRAWTILIGVAVLGFVGLGVALALLGFSGDGTSDADAAEVLRERGCTVTRYPATQAGLHVETSPKLSEYNSFPPTSGPHHGTPAPFDVYEQPVEQFRLVHNLEHGGLVIQYGKDVPRADVDALVTWYRADPNGILIAPLPALNDQISLAAWSADLPGPGERPEPGDGWLAKCRRFDETAFEAFMNAHAFEGPERATREQLAPGS